MISKKLHHLLSSLFYGQYRLDGGHQNYYLPCPFHNSAPNKRHLYVSRETGLWLCFRCEERGNFYQLVWGIKRHVDTDLDVEFYLAGLNRKPHPLINYVNGKAERRLAKPVIEAPKGTVPIYGEQSVSYLEKSRQRAVKYVQSRGVSEHLAEFYGVRVGVVGQYDGRILVPVLAADKTPLGWVARAVTPGLQPKVVNTPSRDGWSVDDTLFGLANVVGLIDDVVLVEGIFDAMKHGLRFLAILGKALTKAQFAALVDAKFKKVTVLLDADAMREGRAMARSLRMFVDEVRVATIEGAKDPGEATLEQVRFALDQSKRV